MVKKSKKTCPDCDNELLEDGSCPTCGPADEIPEKEKETIDETISEDEPLE
jgi:hypothetical protein